MQKMLSIQKFFIRKQEKENLKKDEEKVSEKHREIYHLFVQTTHEEELQKIERWLLK